MDVGVVLELSSPGVQDAGAACESSFEFAGDDVFESCGALLEHEVVELFGVLAAEAPEFGGNGEGHHEVVGWQEAVFLLPAPELLFEGPALGATAVIAAVVGEVFSMAGWAAVETSAEPWGPAPKHASHRPVVGGAEHVSVFVGKVLPMFCEDGCQGGLGSFHVRSSNSGEGVQCRSGLGLADFGQVEVEHGRLEAGMAEVGRDLLDADTRF